jgi:NADH-quinone oxidoreductase subunit F
MTVWGDVERPGVYEVPLGTPIRGVLEDRAGGTPDGVGLVFPGGPAGPPLGAQELDTPVEPDAVRAAGSALGAAALLVVGRSVCPLAAGASLAAFFERANCGQCPPCSVGTASLARILRTLESGGARPRDLRDLADVGGFMSNHGYCAHCPGAARVATGLVQRFSREVEAHLAAGACPEPGRRHADPFSPGSPERAALEAAVAEQLR